MRTVEHMTTTTASIQLIRDSLKPKVGFALMYTQAVIV